MRRKTVYPAHPISGDVAGNVSKLKRIVRDIFLMPGIIPVVPYLEANAVLDDGKPEERAIGINANTEYFTRGMIDEVWLYGLKISNGMRQEILLAWDLGIPVTAKTAMTAKGLKEMEDQRPDDSNFEQVVLRLVKRLEPIDFVDLANRAASIHGGKIPHAIKLGIRDLLEWRALKSDCKNPSLIRIGNVC